MQDIRLVGNDGEYLNLETQTGEQFRLVLDESVRAAVKRENSTPLDEVSISPREIQDAVRAGASAEDIAAKYATPFDYVDKFAQTVMDEIGHIIASAQSVRIAIAADRYSEAKQVEFREVIQDRLHAAGAKLVAWSALKFEHSPWQVSVKYQDASGATKTATWMFDQRKLILSPDNELAAKLSGGELAREVELPKLRAIDELLPNSNESRGPVVVELVTEVIEVVESEPEKPTSLKDVSQASAIEELTKASLESLQTESNVSSKPSVEEPPLTATVDLLEALRRKRAATEASSTEKPTKVEPVSSKTVEPEPSPAAVSDSKNPEVEESEVEAAETSVPDSPLIAPAKKGRPSMPSWDEIVFGTKTED